MRIMGRQDFLALPAGTIFSDFVPIPCTGFKCKEDTIYDNGRAIDFFFRDFECQPDYDSSEELYDNLSIPGKEHSLDFETQEREGLFDETAQYAVWSRKDVHALIVQLIRTR